MTHKIKDHFLAFFTILIWGVTFIVTKYLEEYMSALNILFVRYFIAYVSLWILYPHIVRIKKPKVELMIFFAAASGASVYQYMENLSVFYTSPASVSFITAAAPLVTAVLAHRFLNEKLNIQIVLGMVVSLAGIFLICFGDAGTIETGLLGDVIIIMSIWLWAVYSILVKFISKYKLDHLLVTRRLFFYSLVILLPFVLFRANEFDFGVFRNVRVDVYLLFLGVFASAICFALWNRSVDKLGATVTSKYLFISPVITLIAQSLTDHKSFSAAALAGMMVTLFGIGITEFNFKFRGE